MFSIAQAYQDARQHTEKICQPLQTEDYIPQSAEFASPPKWHLAHTSWFFEEMILKKYQVDFKEYHPDFSFLFNSYYNSIGKRTVREHRGLMTRPSVEEIYAYRTHVDNKMKALLANSPSKNIIELTILGINHEQQHQELLLTDLKYTLSLNPTFPVYDSQSDLTTDENKVSGWQQMPKGIYEIGFEGKGFSFDNELGRHKVFLHDFEISKTLVTYGEYIEFIETGGYSDFRYWLDEGWAWVNSEELAHPLYWQKTEKGWFHFTLAGLQPIQPDAILAHISFYEAYAFATWKKCRLPTEFEWEAASHYLKWGKRWEWTYSAYLPYPNFQIAEGAVGEYNGKFMVNQMVLRGASVATPQEHSRKTYRNFFHPKYNWQFTGIRLAR